MALTLSGKCLEIRTRRLIPKPGDTWTAFDAVTFMVLSGKADIDEVRTTQDFPEADWPKEGEEVTLEVTVGTFGLKSGGAGYQLNAVGRVRAGVRAAPAAS